MCFLKIFDVRHIRLGNIKSSEFTYGVIRIIIIGTYRKSSCRFYTFYCTSIIIQIWHNSFLQLYDVWFYRNDIFFIQVKALHDENILNNLEGFHIYMQNIHNQSTDTNRGLIIFHVF